MMGDYEPVAVALKFGFIVVLYLFLLWVTRSALKDLRRTASPGLAVGGFDAEPHAGHQAEPCLVVIEGGGLERGRRIDLFGGVTIGRSADADIRIEDRYASQIHARIYARRGVHFAEDLDSTNGTLLNSEPLRGEAELRPGDLIRIGDTEFRYEE
jgi:hypothetical protein